MNLSPYFRRISYTGPTTPTLETLSSLLFHHATHIPFENLSVLLNHPLRIDLPSIEEKIIHQNRGGYCFEQNTLLLHVLTTLGFDVTPLSARVRIGLPRDITPPRTHLFLKVTLDNTPYLADVGVGGLTPAAPLLFNTSSPQPTPHEPRRLLTEDHRHFHQAQLSSDPTKPHWIDVYEYTGEPMPEIDRDLANHYTSTHPNSKFKKNLMISLAHPDGTRTNLLNNELTHRRGATILSTQTLKTPPELLETLAQSFNLHFPKETLFGPKDNPWPKPPLA